MGPTRKRGRWLGRLALSLLSLVVVLLAAEALFFFFGPPIVRYERPKFRDEDGNELGNIEDIVTFLSPKTDWERKQPSTQLLPGYRFRMCYDRPRWDYFDEDGCVDVAFNRHGFRDEEFDVEKPPGEWRLLAVGDSFTFGVGVNVEDSWSQVLEHMLQATRTDPVQVINGGWAWGYSPATYGDWIAEEGLAFQPDVVLVGFCLNDADGRVPMMSVIPINERPYWGGERRTPFVVLRRLLEKRAQDREPRVDWGEFVRRVSEQWAETQAGLVRIRDACEAAGARFVVVILPMLSDLQRDYPYRSLHEMVRDFCTHAGIETVDLRERFLGHDELKLWVHPTDQHPNTVGHRMIAEGVFEYLEGRD